MTGDTPGVNEPAGSRRGTDSRAGHAPASGCGIPTTSDGLARSMMAERSGGGSRWETGCGTAPTAQAANMLSTNPIELGRPMVTVEPSATPRAANSAARRSTRSTNPARVNVTSPQVSAGRSGSVSASCRRTGKKVFPPALLISCSSPGAVAARRRCRPVCGRITFAVPCVDRLRRLHPVRTERRSRAGNTRKRPNPGIRPCRGPGPIPDPHQRVRHTAHVSTVLAAGRGPVLELPAGPEMPARKCRTSWLAAWATSVM